MTLPPIFVLSGPRRGSTLLRYILDTQNASSLHLSGVIGGRGFYPGAWHGLASLVAITTGCEIPVAANAVTLVVSAAVWPIGMS